MGYVYACHCNDCSHDFTVYDGSGMMSHSLICQDCGKRSGIPRVAPRPSRGGQLRSFAEMQAAPEMVAEDIVRYTDAELENILANPSFDRTGDRWDDFEIAALIRLRNPCKCAGVMDLESKTEVQWGNGVRARPNMLTRCPVCRSMNFEFKMPNVLWD